MKLSTRRPKLFRASPASMAVIAFLLLPIAAHAQAGGSPFDTGFTAMQNLFTGTVAKVASLIAIVIGGYGFAHGEPGAKYARFAYVSISRGSHEAQIFTDNANEVGERLSHDSSKTSAMTITNEEKPKLGRSQNQSLSQAAGVGVQLSI